MNQWSWRSYKAHIRRMVGMWDSFVVHWCKHDDTPQTVQYCTIRIRSMAGVIAVTLFELCHTKRFTVNTNVSFLQWDNCKKWNPNGLCLETMARSGTVLYCTEQQNTPRGFLGVWMCEWISRAVNEIYMNIVIDGSNHQPCRQRYSLALFRSTHSKRCRASTPLVDIAS